MVDALRRAHHLVRPGGWVVDLHPTAAPAWVEVGTRAIGCVDAGDAPLRHAAAGRALARILDERCFAVDAATDFMFYTYGDTVEELRRHLEKHWRDARIEEAVVLQAQEAMRADPGARPRIREEVRLTTLRPIALSG